MTKQPPPGRPDGFPRPQTPRDPLRGGVRSAVLLWLMMALIVVGAAVPALLRRDWGRAFVLAGVAVGVVIALLSGVSAVEMVRKRLRARRARERLRRLASAGDQSDRAGEWVREVLEDPPLHASVLNQVPAFLRAVQHSGSLHWPTLRVALALAAPEDRWEDAIWGARSALIEPEAVRLWLDWFVQGERPLRRAPEAFDHALEVLLEEGRRSAAREMVRAVGLAPDAAAWTAVVRRWRSVLLPAVSQVEADVKPLPAEVRGANVVRAILGKSELQGSG